MGEGCISWHSKLQQNVTLSTTEAELVAASTTTREAIWLKRLLSDLGHNQESVDIFVDNNGVVQLARNPVLHSRTKHIDIIHFYVRERAENGDIQVSRVDTNENVADIFTKALPQEKFSKHRKALGLIRLEIPN